MKNFQICDLAGWWGDWRSDGHRQQIVADSSTEGGDTLVDSSHVDSSNVAQSVHENQGWLADDAEAHPEGKVAQRRLLKSEELNEVNFKNPKKEKKKFKSQDILAIFLFFFGSLP